MAGNSRRAAWLLKSSTTYMARLCFLCWAAPGDGQVGGGWDQGKGFVGVGGDAAHHTSTLRILTNLVKYSQKFFRPENRLVSTLGFMRKPPQPQTRAIEEVHDLARKGIKIFAVTRDPLTAHASELLFKATTARLTQPQINAALVLRKQVDAYGALFAEPL